MADRADRHLLRDAVHFLFGFDFFISYAHADGMHYPRRLADALGAQGFRVFLDKRLYVAGDDLNVATRTRIRSSRKLILIARPQALVSDWVHKEVHVCLDAGRTPVVVDVNGTLAGAPESSPLRSMLEHRLFISEVAPDPDGEPSEHVLSELARSFRSTRTEALRLRVVSAAAVVLAMLALTAGWQAYEARQRELDALHAAGQFRDLCKEAVRRVDEGWATLQSLKTSRFGELVATVAEELARLPETKGVVCEAKARPPGWTPAGPDGS